MMKDHKSLQAWQEAHAVAMGVIGLSREYWQPYARAVFAQLQRSSLSVQLNLAEGYTFGNSRSFTRFLGIAYGSAVETRELLELSVEADILPSQPTVAMLHRARRAQYLILGLLQKRRCFKS
jgi:four helix bundle protein